MPSLAVLYDPHTSRWLRFSRPLEEIEIHTLDEILPTLEMIEQRVEKEALFAVGYISYEAAPAFDDALQTHAKQDFPLLRFGLFATAEPIDLPKPAEKKAGATWQAQENAGEFAAKVEDIRAAIARGETYQVNLTFALTSHHDEEPWQLFLQLVQAQHTEGAGFLQSDRWAICSVSPELFFDRNGSRLVMSPMKGTAPRGRTRAEDRLQSETLKKSVKNRAENIMILDMVRNDLGRLAPPGEVHTDAICSLEKYPTVWQLTSTASANCNKSLAKIFQALFPCASITGAPKARTMQIIKATEKGPRLIYTGAFGWIAPGLKARFNVAIRTVLHDRINNFSTYGIGAGITWDSDGHDEYRECLDKAAVLFQPTADFALLETLRWTPSQGYFVLDEHLDRLESSAEFFDYDFSRQKVLNYLERLAEDFPSSPQRVRLLHYRDGTLEEKHQPLGSTTKATIKLALADAPVDSKDTFLYHKTTRRQTYERHLARASQQADDVVLWNERGEVTECCTANLVAEIDGQFVTPPLSSGLLAGTYRAFLLQRGILKERVLSQKDIRHAPRIYLINAVRKWRQAIII